MNCCTGCEYHDCERDATTEEIAWEGCTVGHGCVNGSEYVARTINDRRTPLNHDEADGRD